MEPAVSNHEQHSEGLSRSSSGGLKSAKTLRHRTSDIDEQLVKTGESLHYSMFADDIAPANYQVPKYPIQEKESREYFERQLSHSVQPSSTHMSVTAERLSSNKPRPGHTPRRDGSLLLPVASETEEQNQLLPDFQMIKISGEETSGVPFKDLQIASKMLVRALTLREKYMALSQQTFPQVAARFLESLEGEESFRALKSGYVRMFSLEDSSSSTSLDGDHHKGLASRKTLPEHPIHAPPTHGDPFEAPFLSSAHCILKFVNGVMCVYPDQESAKNNIPFDWPHPDLEEFLKDQNMMFALISDGPLKSFCYRRLSYLSHKYQLHVLLNELKESAAQKEVPHRDFYNVHKPSPPSVWAR